MTRPASLLVRDERGNAAAEMALMLPLLTVILFGGIEMGHFFWTEHRVLMAVRDGARFAGRHAFNDFDCSSSTVNSGLVADTQELTRTGNLSGGSPVVRSWTNNSSVSVTLDCLASQSYSGTGIYTAVATPVIDPNTGLPEVDPDTNQVVTEGPAMRVTVSASVNYPALFGGFGFLDFLNGYKLKASAESPVMGF